MTTQTAEHLIRLRTRATHPIVLHERHDHSYMIVVRTPTGTHTYDRTPQHRADLATIDTLIADAVARLSGEAIRQEIIAAATDQRDPQVTIPADILSATSGAARILRDWVLPTIEQEMRRQNAGAAAEYDAYRYACMQAVAVPPQDEQTQTQTQQTQQQSNSSSNR